MPTTTSLSPNRPIEFALISNPIKNMHHLTKPNYIIPWGPHYACIHEFRTEANIIHGNVLCIPKPLPIDHFNEIWQYFDENTQQLYVKNASNRAKKMLQKHKKRTGVAILGQPTQSLATDIKFQSDLKVQSIINGELLAQAALETELLVLEVCLVPRKLQPKYTGRSQYPKFKDKHLTSIDKQDAYHCEHLLYWGEVKGIFTILLQASEGGICDTFGKCWTLSRYCWVLPACTLKECQQS
jgi:hypothetical protein